MYAPFTEMAALSLKISGKMHSFQSNVLWHFIWYKSQQAVTYYFEPKTIGCQMGDLVIFVNKEKINKYIRQSLCVSKRNH